MIIALTIATPAPTQAWRSGARTSMRRSQSATSQNRCRRNAIPPGRAPLRSIAQNAKASGDLGCDGGGEADDCRRVVTIAQACQRPVVIVNDVLLWGHVEPGMRHH
jgi:hypothetical protein